MKNQKFRHKYSLALFTAVYLLIGAVQNTFSQVYPVNATTQVAPPYSVFLSDYVAPGSEQLKLNLFLRDLTEPVYDVRLRLVIEGQGVRIETSPAYNPPPLTIEGGVSTWLDAADLAPLFESRNLIFSGYSKSEFERYGRLPEGFYQFCFTVYDYQHPEIQLSQQSCQNLWLVRPDPPMLNQPACAAELELNEMQQSVIFQWTPMAISPNSSFTTDYIFRLYEIRPEGRNPADITLSSNPIYEIQTAETSLLYGVAEPPLIPGIEYVWQVQAIDLGGRDRFKNNGYSKVCTFKVAEDEVPLPEPGEFKAWAINESMGMASWVPSLEPDGYTVEYRLADNPQAEWFVEELQLPPDAQLADSMYVVLQDLMPQTQYEVRIGSKRGAFVSSWTETKRLTTYPPRVFACGDPQDLQQPLNTTPLISAIRGEVFTIGDFKMRLTKVTGGDGVFSGYGSIETPFLGFNIAVKFDNIRVNELYQVVAGEAVALTDGIDGLIDNWEDGDNGDGTGTDDDGSGGEDDGSEDDFDGEDITYDGEIGDVTVGDDGVITVTDENGTTHTYDQPVDPETGEKKAVRFTDNSGDTWIVGSDGNVTKGGQNSGIEDVVTEADDAKKDKYLKFVIAGTDYMDGDNYYTMYTKKELEIKVEQTDTVTRDLSGITWELEGNKMTPDKDNPTILRFKVKKSNLPKSNNELLVLDSVGNKVSKLKIQTYRGPEIIFDEANIYNGEYLFDHGYEFNPLKGDYATFPIGPNNDIYYAPVLGILERGHATIRVNVKQLKAEASKDPDFSIVIKPSRPGFVSIDNMDSLVLNAQNLNGTSTIIIKALRTINSISLDSISINAYVTATRERVGKMEFYCADRVAKRVKLIFVKYRDESNYPSYLNPTTFETFLDDQVMNQLFLDYEIIADTLNSTYTTNQMQSWTKEEILDSLNIEFHGTDKPSGYSNAYDYFYITNLSLSGSSPGTYLGAFHKVGAPGGVQVKYRKSNSGETAEEATAHELGHWMGFSHTFESNAQTGGVIINPTKGGTRDNYMDYNIRRKKWFKRQLLNYVR